VQDFVQGCSSGVKNIQGELATLIDRQLEDSVRACFFEVGLGERFNGIDCLTDFQCDSYGGKCNHETQKCVIGSTHHVDDAYLRCYIGKMSSSLEEYLRVNVLPSSVASRPSGSEEFFMALKEAATVDDCISINEAMDISMRARYVWSASSDACKARALGVPEDDTDLINELCPDGYCLGDSCRQSTAQCFVACEEKYVYSPSSESDCSLAATSCPVSEIPGGGCDGDYCVYCPGGEDEDCQYVSSDEGLCGSTVACEMNDGVVLFGLTEEECNAQASYCTVDCIGESCRSLDNLYGVCLATVGSETACNNVNDIDGVEAFWYDDAICVVSTDRESTCAELQATIGVSTNWETCESLSTNDCDGSDAYQRYLKCFVDLWRTCNSQEECEAAGHCSDREWTTIVRSEDQPIDVQYGACFSSGFSTASTFIRDPFCYLSMERPGIGCRDPSIISSDDCIPFEQVTTLEWWWRAWLTPAMPKEECMNFDDGRRGCQQPGPVKNLIWLDEEGCTCRGGYTEYAWTWTEGIWKTGVARPLEWRLVQPIVKYEWSGALSYELLDTWLKANEEQKFSFTVKSEVFCETETVSSSLNTLVCDCFDENENTGDCYIPSSESKQETEVEYVVGITGACFQEESFVKGPSSRVSFSEESVTTGCLRMNLSLVKQAWFVAPPPDPSLSFEFEEKPTNGIVLNRKSSVVGVLRGDGSVLSFSSLANLQSFSVCLRVTENQTDVSKYPIVDFGYSEEPVGTIYPLGIAGSISSELVFGSLFWCGEIENATAPKDGNNIRLFPIQRIEDYEEEEEEYTSRQTRALMYTLGVCYCIDFVLLSFYLINFVRLGRSSTMLGIISSVFLVLCVPYLLHVYVS